MPIYEYQCKQCGKVFEYMQRMSEDPKTECEECSGRLERLISRSAFHLKGGGWYKDLYSSVKPENKSSEGTASSGADSTAASSSKDSSSTAGSSAAASSSGSSSSGSSSSGSGSSSSGSSSSGSSSSD